jgi:hypothetical protein
MLLKASLLFKYPVSVTLPEGKGSLGPQVPQLFSFPQEGHITL